MTNFEAVGEFHRKFGIFTSKNSGEYSLKHLRLIDDETFLYRYQHLQEELQELLSAHRDRDFPRIADALVDLVYVALGTAHFYGIPFDEVFEEVHNANMRKERAVSKDDYRTKRGSAFDVVKPEGWIPPDIAGILVRR